MCASRPQPLTLDEKIGQLFAVRAYGVFMNEASPQYRHLIHEIRDNHIGGIVWFQSNVYETALLNQKLQRESHVPLPPITARTVSSGPKSSAPST